MIMINHKLKGNYTEEALQRTGKGTDLKKLVAEKLTPHFKNRYNHSSFFKEVENQLFF